MLKLPMVGKAFMALGQPPSGGCVLKQRIQRQRNAGISQPPSGGCVLKHHGSETIRIDGGQPPSGGCVLKRIIECLCKINVLPAAFRRLCVETCLKKPFDINHVPAAFRRLCVETTLESFGIVPTAPAAFRRLCVETVCCIELGKLRETSRLQAAVC